MYYPNGYTTGAGTLADDVLTHTGFHNIAGEAGLTGGGTLPLERLVMAAPQVIVTSTPYPGASRAEEIWPILHWRRCVKLPASPPPPTPIGSAAHRIFCAPWHR